MLGEKKDENWIHFKIVLWKRDLIGIIKMWYPPNTGMYKVRISTKNLFHHLLIH
jgi:hypothetical protein